MRKNFFLFTLTLLFLTACAEAVQSPPVDRKTPLYETSRDFENRISAESQATDLVATQFGYDPSQIILLNTAEKTWIDSCLELPNVSEECFPNEVPGYLILLFAENQVFEVHSDAGSQNIRAINYLSQYSSPLELAIRYLSAVKNLPAEEINVVTFDPVDWPDSCLGVTNDGTVCAPVVTPGYKIELRENNTTYEFHTDFYGSRLYQTK